MKNKIEFNLDIFQYKLTKSLILALFATLILLTIANFAYHHDSQILENKYEKIKLNAAINALTSRISENLLVVSSSNTFRDFIRSGESTREKLLLEISFMLSPFNFLEISGLELLDSDSNIIFKKGTPTDTSIEAKICYINDVINPQYGSCRASWRIHFNLNQFVKRLQQIDPRIEACTSCENFNLAQSDLFSQFVIPAGINVPIGVRLNSGTTQNQAYWMEVLLILSFVGFGAYLILRTRRQINRGLATPLTQIVDAIDNEREDLELDQSAVFELKLVVKSLKSWRKRFLAAQKVQAEAQMVTLARQVAHDIRSPLSAIQIAAASIEKSPAEAKQLIAQSASRIQSIAEDILTKSRNKCDTQTTDINQICKEIAQEKNAVIPNHRKIEILTICEENIRASQSVSDSDLRRVLSNLINNSIDACGEIGEIKIKATKNSSICVIDIIDNGKGIPEELAHNIGCEGFTYGKATGNGLGLFNAKQLVQSWGGTISIHSKEDVGTTVSMQLPLSNC